jgi:hypothetical protein
MDFIKKFDDEYSEPMKKVESDTATPELYYEKDLGVSYIIFT